MIIFIKVLHTAIWLVMTTAVMIIGYSVYVMRFDVLFFVSIILIASE